MVKQKKSEIFKLNQKTLEVVVLVKVPEAQARKFSKIFVCKKCSTKIRTQNIKIIQGKVKCRRCQSKKFRSVRKK